MATSIRFQWDRTALRTAALSGPGVRAAVRAETERIAARAKEINASSGHSDLTTVETAMGGETRARGYVMLDGAAGLAREAKYRILGRAVDGD